MYAAVLAGICLYDACSCHAITEWKRPGAAAVPSDPANASLLSPAGGARCAGGKGRRRGEIREPLWTRRGARGCLG